MLFKKLHDLVPGPQHRESINAENGEEIDQLPYVRPSRRIPQTHILNSQQVKSTENVLTTAVKEISPDRLLATKRIITAFNSGDVDVLKEIVFESTIDTCEVYFSSLKHVFIGKSALFSLWTSLFDAFPNGIFRTSDSVINEKKQVFTSFLFFGTKIFPLLIDGMPLELLSVDDALSSNCNTINPDSNNAASANNCGPNSTISDGPQFIVQSASVVADRNRPLYTTLELLEMDRVPEMVFEGRIVLHMNEYCMIKRFDFSWSRKV